MKTDRDTLGLTALVLSTMVALLLVPDLSIAALRHPAGSAVISTVPIFTLIIVMRARGRRGSALERYLFAGFLGFMPLVYVSSHLWVGGSPEWLWLELGGLVVFAALAILGLRYSTWIIVAGIAAHGLLWDSWHYGRTSFMPDWYAGACLLIDVGWAIYAATQVSAWRGEHKTSIQAPT